MMYVSMAFTIVIAIIVLQAYRAGLRDGNNEGRPITPKPLFALPKQPKKEPSEDDKMLEWAENYKG